MDTTKSGYTLLEVMISSAIFSSIMLITLIVMNSATQAVTTAREEAYTQSQTMKTINTIAEQMREAKITVLSGGRNNQMTYLVPVDHDGDGDVFDDTTMDIIWGSRILNAEYEDKSHTDPMSIQTFNQMLLWVPDTGPGNTETTVSEADRQTDINNDGDLRDIFKLGRIVLRLSSGQIEDTGELITAPSDIPLSPPYVVQVEDASGIGADPNGDINGDGTPDEIFVQGNKALTITLYLMDPSEKHPVLVKAQTSVGLRNADVE